MLRTMPVWMSVAGFFLTGIPAAAQRPADVFESMRLPPEPFETAPFHPVRIPEWVRGTVGVGYTLSVLDQAAREKAAGAGVTISEMGFVDPFYAYYDSKLLERRNPNVPVARIRQEIAEYQRLGVRILGVYPPTLQGEVWAKHPEWRRIATNTTVIPEIDLEKYPHGGMLCPLGPYGDFFIDLLAEILTEFPEVDAFSFDGLHYGSVCYCDSCRTRFRRDTGGEIPNPDLNDPAFRRYQHWADRRMEELIQRMQTRLKGIKPEVALVTWTTNAGRFGHFLSIPRNMPSRMNLLLDAPDQEFWLDETNRGATIVPAFANAYIWATTNHRVAFSEPYLMSHGNPYGTDSFPPHEILRRMLLAATYGAGPSIAVIHLREPESYAVLSEMQRRKPWLTHKQPERWGALLMSDNTKTFYGRTAGAVEERYLAHVFGAFRAGAEAHLPINLINDWNLNPTDLAKYRVLILPDAACLDAAQTRAIEEFVKNGGGLVATADTSLFNEFGDPRENFSLAETFGVDYRSPAIVSGTPGEIDVNFAQAIGPDYWEKRKNVFDFRPDWTSDLWTDQTQATEGVKTDAAWLKSYLRDQPVTFKGAAIRVALRDGANAKVAGTLQPKDNAQVPPIPAIVTRTHGKGRVVYLAGGFDAGYYLYPYPYQRLVLTQAIRWAAHDTPPIQVTAPMCVHATTMRQIKDGERLIVNLYNDVNTTAFHALPNDDVPLREETLPIHDIKIMFAPSYKFRRLHLEPEGILLTAKTTAAGTEVIVPRLEIHTMVVGELE